MAKDALQGAQSNRLHYVTINELEMGNYFGEIGAISDLRRTSSVVAINSMLIGKLKIDLFRQFMEKSSNFEKKIRRKILSYRDPNLKIIFNMIKVSSLFGQFVSPSILEKITIDLISMMREDNYHHMDKILELGEISDRLYFVTKGKVGVFVNVNSRQYYENYVDS